MISAASADSLWRHDNAWRTVKLLKISCRLPQNWVVRSPPYFAEDILGMTPKTWKI